MIFVFIVVDKLIKLLFEDSGLVGSVFDEKILENFFLFGDKVFSSIIPRNVRLAEAPSYGMPGIAFDKASRGAQAYLEFGAEMILRVEAMNLTQKKLTEVKS